MDELTTDLGAMHDDPMHDPSLDHADHESIDGTDTIDDGTGPSLNDDITHDGGTDLSTESADPTAYDGTDSSPQDAPEAIDVSYEASAVPGPFDSGSTETASNDPYDETPAGEPGDQTPESYPDGVQIDEDSGRPYMFDQTTGDRDYLSNDPYSDQVQTDSDTGQQYTINENTYERDYIEPQADLSSEGPESTPEESAPEESALEPEESAPEPEPEPAASAPEGAE
jgi:hypothetical protein